MLSLRVLLVRIGLVVVAVCEQPTASRLLTAQVYCGF